MSVTQITNTQTITFLKSGFGRSTFGPIKIETYEYYGDSSSSEETTVMETTLMESIEETTPIESNSKTKFSASTEDIAQPLSKEEITTDECNEDVTHIQSGEETTRFESENVQNFVKSDETGYNTEKLTRAVSSENITPINSIVISAHIESSEEIEIFHPMMNDEINQLDLIEDAAYTQIANSDKKFAIEIKTAQVISGKIPSLLISNEEIFEKNDVHSQIEADEEISLIAPFNEANIGDTLNEKTTCNNINSEYSTTPVILNTATLAHSTTES